MTWIQLALLLVCPLMMLFCMRGMFGDHKCEKKQRINPKYTEIAEVKDLQMRVKELEDGVCQDSCRELMKIR